MEKQSADAKITLCSCSTKQVTTDLKNVDLI